MQLAFTHLFLLKRCVNLDEMDLLVMGIYILIA